MIFGNFLVSFWSRFGPPAAIMRPERAPRRAKMDPKNSQGVPKWQPGDKQWNFNDFLKLSGPFLEPFWAQHQGKNWWILVAKIYAQKANRLYAKNSLKRGIKTQFFGWWIQRCKPKYIMWKSLNSCRKTVFLKDQHVFVIWKKTLKISVKINARKCVGQNVKNKLILTKKWGQNLSKSCQNSTPKISS